MVAIATNNNSNNLHRWVAVYFQKFEVLPANKCLAKYSEFDLNRDSSIKWGKIFVLITSRYSGGVNCVEILLKN